jgi:hypothetical protein
MVATRKKAKSPIASVSSKKVATTVPGFVLMHVESGDRGVSKTKPGNRATDLLPRVGKALDKPGIARRPAIKDAYVYSTYEKDPSKVVRRSSDGKTQVGTLTSNGHFRASKTKA